MFLINTSCLSPKWGKSRAKYVCTLSKSTWFCCSLEVVMQIRKTLDTMDTISRSISTRRCQKVTLNYPLFIFLIHNAIIFGKHLTTVSNNTYKFFIYIIKINCTNWWYKKTYTTCLSHFIRDHRRQSFTFNISNRLNMKPKYLIIRLLLSTMYRFLYYFPDQSKIMCNILWRTYSESCLLGIHI